MNEVQLRQKIVDEAKSWIGTPYVSNGMIKGKRGGVDCAMFPLAVYASVGLIPKEFDPRPYPPQWHVHRNEEKYMAYVLRFAKEVIGPPDRKPKAGDFVMFKIGQVFAHGAIVIDWPNIIHAVGDSMVVPEDVSKNTVGKRALWTVPKHFFTPLGLT
jgi:cell wall-associated NlpC family hydrolase